VALKFQYLHTSALPPCPFALATLKIPGGENTGIKAAQGSNGGLTMPIDNMEVIMPHHHSLWLPLHLLHLSSRAPPVVVPARVKVPVVVVSDEGDSGVPVVSGVSDKKPPIPKRNAKPKPKAMHTCLQEGSAPAKPAGLKVKAKPKPPAGPAPGVSGVAGVAGAKRKNSRSPSAGGKRKIARSAASSSSAAGGSSGAQIPLRQPLLGQSFRIYSAGMRQASDRDFMSPS